MASEVDICNLALAHLGDEATVSAIAPSDGSQQADYCVRFYPIARDALIAMHAWSFATRRIALAEMAANESDTWAYAYAAPVGALTIISVLEPETTDTFITTDPSNPYFAQAPQPGDTNTQPYIQEVDASGNKIIYSDVEAANCRYITSITDTTKFPPLVVIAIARLLAAYLAGPLIKGEAGMKVSQQQLQVFSKIEAPMAMTMDTKGQRVNLYKNYTPDALQVRR